MELQEGGFYRVRDSEDPGWEPIARFDSMKADRAYFGDPRDEDCRFFVSKEAVASGRSTIEPVVLQEALTADVTYAVASTWWGGKRRLTYRGPDTPFINEDGYPVYVLENSVLVAFLTGAHSPGHRPNV